VPVSFRSIKMKNLGIFFHKLEQLENAGKGDTFSVIILIQLRKRLRKKKL
jgi:hypothetical protein